MQRLMHVLNEMDQKLQCLRAHRVGLCAIGKQRALTHDRFDHAVAIRAVFRCVIRAAVFGQIDVMPARGALAKIRIMLAQIIGPVGDTGQRGISFAAQEPRDFGTSLRGEFAVGERCGQAMSFRPPGVCGCRQQRNDEHGDERR